MINDEAAKEGQDPQFKVRYPIAFHTVDGAVTRTTDGQFEVLLIQKKAEVGSNQWRFPGGFVDPGDDSAEAAVRREVDEETGGYEVGAPEYICSAKIDDPRYRNSVHKIITSFFEVPYLWGKEKAGDDAEKAEWKTIAELQEKPEMRNPIHEKLFQALFARQFKKNIGK